ncbi:hypothetical protein ACET3Z_031698 [Daucus carota]
MVSVRPDLANFNMTHLEDDVLDLTKKRVVNIAGCLGRSVKVELNGIISNAHESRLSTIPNKSGIVNSLLSWAMFKLTKDLKTTDGSKKGRVTGIPKLVDANEVVGANLGTAPKF